MELTNQHKQQLFEVNQSEMVELSPDLKFLIEELPDMSYLLYNEDSKLLISKNCLLVVLLIRAFEPYNLDVDQLNQLKYMEDSLNKL